MNQLVKEFDAIIDEACHESMTVECPNESAYRAASEWRARCDGVRKRLESLLADSEPLADLQQAVRALYDCDQALLNCRDCEVADKLKDKEAAIDKLYELTGVPE